MNANLGSASLTPENRAEALVLALQHAVWLYENYGLLAQPIEGYPLAAGRWIGEARSALQSAGASPLAISPSADPAT